MEDGFNEMFENATENGSIIKVIGVGGAGCNAVSYMYSKGIEGVTFIVANTDMQSLTQSSVPLKIQLGSEGLGAGSNPEEGRRAAEESLETITAMLENTKMLFISAGMGGGTGTGATPVIAKAAREKGILTVAIVNIPFKSFNKKLIPKAFNSIRDLQPCVDSLIVINNEKLRELYGTLKTSESLNKANEVVYTATKEIAEIITLPGEINIDFKDVKRTMEDSGITLMGRGCASGKDRVQQAVQQALYSPLLCNNTINGAKRLIVNIMMGDEDDELTLDETSEITETILQEAGDPDNVKIGFGKNPKLGNEITVSIIATGFAMEDINENGDVAQKEKKPTESEKFVINTDFSNDAEFKDERWDDALVVSEVEPFAEAAPVRRKVTHKKKPFLIDPSIPQEYKDGPSIHRHQKKQHNSNAININDSSDEAVSLFALNGDNKVVESVASYLRSVPD